MSTHTWLICWVALVGFEVVDEGGDGVGVLAVGDVDDAALIDVDEQGDVVVAAAGGGLVDRHAAQLGKVHAGDGGIDVVVDDAPQAGVVLAEEAGDGGDRHVGDERHGERLEQQGEAGAGARPRDGDEVDAAILACDAGRPGVRKAWCWKKSRWRQVLLRCRGPDNRRCRTAGQAKRLPGGKSIVMSSRLLSGVEAGCLDHPRRQQAERELEQIGIAHDGISCRPMSLNPAAVLAAVKTWPGGTEPAAPPACRPVLTAASRDGHRERQVGAKGWSSIEQRDGTGSPRIKPTERASPTQDSEEA